MKETKIPGCQFCAHETDEEPVGRIQTEINFDAYFSRDGSIDARDKTTMFLKWCKEEGVIMPKLQYPAYFENGLVGVRCTSDI